MGPRSFDRGNAGMSILVTSDIALQWGRDLSIAEMYSPRSIWAICCSLQWGRDLSIAEIRLLRRMQRIV